MPIIFTPETNQWIIKDPSKEELKAIVKVGKMMIVEGMAGAFTNNKYKTWLANTAIDQFFNA